MATFADAAFKNPNLVKNMFTSYGNYTESGTTVQIYGVHFYNTKGQETTVIVDDEFPATIGNTTAYAGVYGDIWVALAEKAYVIAGNQGITVETGSIAPGADSYSAINGGYPVNAMKALTGQNAYTTTTSNANLVSTDGYLEVLTTSAYQPASTYIVPNHCYALLSTSQSGTYNDVIFNPWNVSSTYNWNNHTVYGGLFYANQAFLNQNFACLSY